MIRQAKIPKVPFDYNGSKAITGKHKVEFQRGSKL